MVESEMERKPKLYLGLGKTENLNEVWALVNDIVLTLIYVLCKWSI